jgi:hypothetical protein
MGQYVHSSRFILAAERHGLWGLQIINGIKNTRLKVDSLSQLLYLDSKP